MNAMNEQLNIIVPRDLSEQAIVVNMTIHQWRPYRSDERADLVVQQAFDSDRSAGVYRKNLLPQNPPEWRSVTAAATEIGMLHRWYTQPWETGGRVLASALYPVYSEKIRAAREKYSVAVEEFIAAFPRIKADAIERLGKLARDKDYPDSDAALRATFGVTIATVPLATNDWRVKLGRDAIDDLTKSYEETLARALEASTSDLWSRLREAVEDLRNSVQTYNKRLAQQDAGEQVRAVLKTGTFKTLSELVEVMPAMNLGQDLALDGLVDRVKETLASVDLDEVRESDKARESVISEADNIVAQMAAFMGGK